MRTGRTLLSVLVLAGLLAPVAAAQTSPDQVEFFEKNIRPVLVEHCYQCHSAQVKRPKGKLRLDSRAALLKGGESGPAVVPGAPAKSKLIEAIQYKNVDLQMPERGKLSDKHIADMVQWVAMGAPWPAEKETRTAAGSYDFDLQQRKKEHWAWQPVRPHQPPAVKDKSWPLTPADAFLLARLEAKGIAPAPPADRRTLLRRLYFDLIGLPPTPAEVEAFVQDRSPHAVATVVDRLLASEHFGERWGKHWLDLVRYAESRGHEFDYTLPNAHQYRDYVIRAFNADVPYNQFVTEHIAGDLLPRPRLHPAGFNESILGTGFWFLGEQVHSPVDICQDKADRFDNMIDVMGKTFLGLTVACARCHDHKFDAISSRDYYALAGFLESSSYRLVRFDSVEHNRVVADKLDRLQQRSRPAFQKALAGALRPKVERLADYLLAAAAVGGKIDQARLNQVARDRHLDPALLVRWQTFLLQAARQADHPFHAFARVAAEPGAPDEKRIAALVQPVLDTGRKQEAAARDALKNAFVVADYTTSDPRTWIQDGDAFRAQRPGEATIFRRTDWQSVLQSKNVGTLATFQFNVHGAAVTDPAWDRLQQAPGAENEPGALSGYVRSGKTLRTPTFVVKTGRVYYLVRGNAHAYAAVEGHVMIAGPLHGQLVTSFKTGPQLQWVAQDLSAYKGRLVHIEFTPTGGSDFAVALVVQAETTPGLPDRPGQALAQILSGKRLRSVAALASGYQDLVKGTVNRLANDELFGAPTAAEDARLLNSLLQDPELFGLQQEPVRKTLIETLRPFAEERARLVSQIKVQSRLAPAMLDGNGTDEPVFIRGSYKTPGELAPRRFLEALAGVRVPGVSQGSGRLELARQMTDPAINPLISRVLVNRVWHHLFGRGIVGSVDNFGKLGEEPTHPEMLDYLADRFVQENWSVKKLIRTLVLSRAYQMSSRPNAQAQQADPENLLLHRMRLRRLEGEAIRDAILTVSKQLKNDMYGPSVPVYLTDFQQGRGRPTSGPLDGAGRRSLYLSVRRNFLSPFLQAFDTPTPFSTVGRRSVSNVPAQALILLNDPFVHQQAEQWARQVVAQGKSPAERIQAMYLSAFGRPPRAAELQACLQFLDRQAHRTQPPPSEVAVWAGLAHVLFNTKEFIYLQ